MNISTIAGLVLGFGALVGALIMEGGSVASFVNPSAALIVFGGTFGATLISFPGGTIVKLPKLIMRTVINRAPNVQELSDVFVGLSERARREGLLALEEELTRIENPMLKKGIMLVVDGTDPELVRSVLISDISVRERETESETGLLEAMGGYAPTMGIIGTVMGLVNVLGNMTDPSKLGASIAVAFIATFYGIGSANLMWLPFGSKLKKMAESGQVLDEMIMEGVASIQSGENPRVLQERLSPYLYGQKKKGEAAKEQEADGFSGGARQEAQA